MDDEKTPFAVSDFLAFLLVLLMYLAPAILAALWVTGNCGK
jgi:hypothetical protein